MSAQDIIQLLQHLLAENVAPTEEETDMIYSLIEYLSAEACRLENGTKNRATRQQAAHRLCAVKESINGWRATLSAVRRLPPETLAQIFLCLYERDLTPDGPEGRGIDSLPWSVSQVSKHWRQTALCEPALWRRLPLLDLSISARRTIKRRRDLFEVLIKRAEFAELDVFIYAPDIEAPRHELLAFMASYCDIWASLHVSSTAATIDGLRSIRGGIPRLTCLAFDFGQFVMTHQSLYVTPSLDMFQDAPSLLSVEIMGTYQGKMPLPTQRLAFISDMSCALSVQMCRQSAAFDSLTTLYFCEGFDNHDKRREHVWLRFPNLTSLFLMSGVPLEGNFLDYAIFPVLDDVAIRVLPDDVSVYKVMRNAVIRSRCTSLSNMRLYARGTEAPAGLMALLRETPNVHSLMTLLPSTRDILKLASVWEGGAGLVPKLFKCRFYITQEVKDVNRVSALHKLGRSRWSFSGHLYLYVDGGRDLGKSWHRSILRQTPFERFHPNPRENSLLLLHKKLHDELIASNLPDADIPQAAKDISLTLTAIETFPHPMNRNVRYELLESDMHVTLSKNIMFPTHLEAEFDQVYSLMNSILRLWRPLFEEIAPEIRWVWETGECFYLEYVPRSCPSRDSPTFVDTIMGLPANHALDLSRDQVTTTLAARLSSIDMMPNRYPMINSISSKLHSIHD